MKRVCLLWICIVSVMGYVIDYHETEKLRTQEMELVLRLRNVISEELSTRTPPKLFYNMKQNEDNDGNEYEDMIKKECDEVSIPGNKNTLFFRLALNSKVFRKMARLSVPRENTYTRCRKRNSLVRKDNVIRGRSLVSNGKSNDGDYDGSLPSASVIFLVSMIPGLAIVLIGVVIVISFFTGNHPLIMSIFYTFSSKDSDLKTETTKTPDLRDIEDGMDSRTFEKQHTERQFLPQQESVVQSEYVYTNTMSMSEGMYGGIPTNY